MSIFDKRVAFKPFEYPGVIDYKNAINHSYWLVSEWNFLSDIQDFNVRLSENERHVIKNAMLAISQIEISVKKFWTKIGDRFPKAEFEQVGVTFGECFADGTEILTPSGWVNLENISVGDEVMQFHPDNTVSITTVRHKTDQYYKGDMVRFHKASAEALVTPNHRMVYYNHKGEYVEAHASELPMKNTCNKIPEAASIRGGEVNSLSFMDRLRVAIQADGNRRFYKSEDGIQARKGRGAGAEYDIKIKKARKIERLDWILENLPGLSFSKLPMPGRLGMVSYTIRIDADFDYKDFDWVDLHDKSSSWCKEFVEETSLWDGNKTSHGRDCLFVYNSTNKAAADKVQAVGVCAGYRTNLMECPDKRKETYNTIYRVSFTDNRMRVTLPPLKAESVSYEGFVRCVTVDSGAVVTRYHGKTLISGNSEVRHSDAYSHLLEVLGLNNEFDQLMQNPVIQGRVDYLTKYLKGAADNSNEGYTLTLTLFSIFIENVSLFSQFLIIKSFNKHLNCLKDIDNVVQATQKEELIHALFGVYVIKQVQKEFPGWFDENFYLKLSRACKKAYTAECLIIDWIFEKGDLPFLGKAVVKEFVKNRFNESLAMIGAPPPFEVDHGALSQVKWFNDEIYAEVNTDFFHKRPVTYSKKVKAIKAEDLF